MEKEIHEQYEYARRRIKQKKRLYFHFVVFVIGSLLLFITSLLSENPLIQNSYLYVITLWLFLFILHFIKVFITDRFMNKNWERDQIERLVALQQKKIKELETKVANDQII